MIFICRETAPQSVREVRAGARCAAPARPDGPSGACRRASHRPSRRIEPARRRGAAVGQFRPLQPRDRPRYRKQYLPSGPAPPGEFSLGLIGTGRVGDVRLRGRTNFDVSPTARFRTAELSAYWSASENVDWEGALAYDALQPSRPRADHATSGASNTLGARADRRSGDRRLGRGRLQPQLLARSAPRARRCRAGRWPQAGSVHATVYRDLNDNGVRDPGEPLEKGALITTGTHARPTARPTPGARSPSAASPPSRRSPSASTQTSLADPMLVPEEGAAGGRAAAGRSGGGRRSAWSAAAISKARSSRAAGSASKASTSSWSTPPARSSPPRAPISTASSCSSAWPTAPTRCGSAQGFGGGGEDRAPTSASALQVTAEKSVVRLGAIHVDARCPSRRRSCVPDRRRT